MDVITQTIVELKMEEAEAIKHARDILCDYESNSRGEQDDALLDGFHAMMGYYDTDYSALPMVIDFLTFLLRESGWEDEEGEEEEE